MADTHYVRYAHLAANASDKDEAVVDPLRAPLGFQSFSDVVVRAVANTQHTGVGWMSLVLLLCPQYQVNSTKLN